MKYDIGQFVKYYDKYRNIWWIFQITGFYKNQYCCFVLFPKLNNNYVRYYRFDVLEEMCTLCDENGNDLSVS